MDRYEGKPLLRLLECYVLDAIDQLDDRERDTLQRMVPKLATLYKRNGTWSEIIRDEMNFPDSLPAIIREIWNINLARMHSSGIGINPNYFAMTFVDENFSDVSR